MDAFVKDQTLFGISKFTLNNMVQDPSYIHETLTYRLYRSLGVPTPRTGYANVTLNGRDYGLHLNIETMDKILLARWGISTAHLYKGAVPYFPDFYEGRESQFAIESGSKTDTSDLTAFIKIQAMRGPAWWAEMGKIADMKQMTLGWAVELYAGHWDGYVMNKNNYFLNFDKTGKVTLLPWGTDQTWNGSLNYFRSPALMINKCWAVPQCKLIYEQSLAEVANKAEQLDLETMAGDVSRAITEDVARDPFGPGYNVVTDYQNGTVWRLGNQLGSLQSISAPWDTGLQSVTVNNVAYNLGSTVYLPAGTRQVSVEALTTEYDARAIVSNPDALKDGLNTITVQVTSANGKHSRTETVNIYVYKTLTTKSAIGFAKSSSKLISKGTLSLDSLISKLSTSQKLVLTVSMPRSKTLSLAKNNVLLKQRTDFIVKALTAKGIKATKVTKSLASTGTADYLTISASYVK
jgi:outer membrane protein OmpA-like peptidoglycan-associated protein